MIPDKSVLLEQINTVIRNSYKEVPELPDLSLLNNGRSPNFTTELSSLRNSFVDKKNKESLTKLEQRIEALEDQNNYLLYFIHFLYENFPGLVRNLLPTGTVSGASGGAVLQERSVDRNVRQPMLTKREVEVLDLLVKGLCAKEIADNLFISETTVITHKKNLKKKYNVKNTVELISKAYTLR